MIEVEGDPFEAGTFLRGPGSYLSLLSAQHYLDDPYDNEAMAACRRRLEPRVAILHCLCYCKPLL